MAARRRLGVVVDEADGLLLGASTRAGDARDRNPHVDAEALAGRVQGELADLGLYRLENRDWLPHVTVLRYRDPPRLSPELPELGPIVPSEAAAYLSRLHPSGAVYEVLESFPLKSLNSRGG